MWNGKKNSKVALKWNCHPLVSLPATVTSFLVLKMQQFIFLAHVIALTFLWVTMNWSVTVWYFVFSLPPVFCLLFTVMGPILWATDWSNLLLHSVRATSAQHLSGSGPLSPSIWPGLAWPFCCLFYFHMLLIPNKTWAERGLSHVAAALLNMWPFHPPYRQACLAVVRALQGARTHFHSARESIWHKAYGIIHNTLPLRKWIPSQAHPQGCTRH